MIFGGVMAPETMQGRRHDLRAREPARPLGWLRRSWSRLSIRTRLIVVATVPQLIYTNAMTWLGNQTLQRAIARMDAHLADFPPLRATLHEVYSDRRLLLYVVVSLGVGLVSALGATVIASRLRSKLDRLREAAGRIASGNLESPVGVSGTGEIGQIGEALDEVREKLRSRIDLEVRNAQLEQDFALARTVESLFLPIQDLTESDTATLAVYHRAGPRGSGDLWHYHRDDEGTVWVLLGDVAGTGPGPAMIAAAIMTSYRLRLARGELRAPSALLHGLHDIIRTIAKDKHRVAAAILRLGKSGEFTWWSAGMTALLMRSGAEVTALSSASLQLGSEPVRISEEARAMTHGDLIIAFTSGVLEARRTTVDGMLAWLAALPEEARSTGEGLARAISSASNDEHPEDQTLVALRSCAGGPP